MLFSPPTGDDNGIFLVKEHGKSRGEHKQSYSLSSNAPDSGREEGPGTVSDYYRLYLF